MPTPDGLKTTPLHGKYVEPNAAGTPLQGTVTFTPNPDIILFPVQNVVVAGTETATLDANGEFNIVLIATDTTGENPSGWLYTVTEKLIGQKQRSYSIALPYSPTTIELADITPTDAAPSYIPVTGPVGSTGLPGVVQSVNGYSTASITLGAADVNAVPLTQRAAANGVATLDAGIKIPAAQIPDLSGTYVLSSLMGAASGVATLDSASVLTASQLNLALATPPAIGTGAVGTSLKPSRADHTHDGMALTSAQSASGLKNFTTGVQTAQLGVGVAPGVQRVHVVSTVDEIGIQFEQVTITGGNPHFASVGFDTGGTAFATKVAGDALNRLAIKTSGFIEFGGGAVARDTTLYRSVAGVLNSNQFSADAAAPTGVSHLTRKDYVDGLDGANVKLSTAQNITGTKTFTTTTMVALSGTAATDDKLSAFVSGDTVDRFRLSASGSLNFGAGGATARDTTFSRTGAGRLAVTGTNAAFGVGSAYIRPVLASVSTTVANTATETTVATYSIPAGEAVVGATYRVRVLASVSFLASATLTWRAKIGTVTLATAGPTTLSTTAQTNKEEAIEVDVICVSTGATGTWFSVLQEVRNTTDTGSVNASGPQIVSSDTPLTADTTVAQSITVTAQWGAASTSNTLTTYCILERIA